MKTIVACFILLYIFVETNCDNCLAHLTHFGFQSKFDCGGYRKCCGTCLDRHCCKNGNDSNLNQTTCPNNINNNNQATHSNKSNSSFNYFAFYSVFASVGIIFIGLIVYSRREKRNRIHRQSSINGERLNNRNSNVSSPPSYELAVLANNKNKNLISYSQSTEDPPPYSGIYRDATVV